MSDLIERLRSWQGNLCHAGTPKAECWEAADELERLRERAERAEAGLDALGVAIANAGYVWTHEMRAAYEKATNREG